MELKKTRRVLKMIRRWNREANAVLSKEEMHFKLTFQEASRSSTTPLSRRLSKVLAFREHKFFFRSICTLVWRLFWSETLGVFLATFCWENHLFRFRFDVKLSNTTLTQNGRSLRKHLPVIGQYCLLIGCCLVTFTPYLAFKFFKRNWARRDKTFLVLRDTIFDCSICTHFNTRPINFM